MHMAIALKIDIGPFSCSVRGNVLLVLKYNEILDLYLISIKILKDRKLSEHHDWSRDFCSIMNLKILHNPCYFVIHNSNTVVN